MVTLDITEAHDSTCDIENRVEGRRVDLFYKYWTKGPFMFGNNFFIYNENVLTKEAQY